MKCINNQIMDKGAGTISQYLILSVNGYFYAVKVPYVYKIVELPCVSTLPCEKPYISGVTKVGGAVYTIVDLRILFGAEPRTSQKRTMAVLLVYGGSKICAVADNVLSVTGIDTNAAVYTFQTNCCVDGAVQVDGEIICLLSMENLFMCEDVQ